MLIAQLKIFFSNVSRNTSQKIIQVTPLSVRHQLFRDIYLNVCCVIWNSKLVLFYLVTSLCSTDIQTIPNERIVCAGAPYKNYANFQFSYVIYGLQLKYIKNKFISWESRQLCHFWLLPFLVACLFIASFLRVDGKANRLQHKMPFELYCCSEKIQNIHDLFLFWFYLYVFSGRSVAIAAVAASFSLLQCRKL